MRRINVSHDSKKESGQDCACPDSCVIFCRDYMLREDINNFVYYYGDGWGGDVNVYADKRNLFEYSNNIRDDTCERC